MINGIDTTSPSPRQALKTTMQAAATSFLAGTDSDEEASILPSGNATLVIRQGDVVVKAHKPEADASELEARLRLIAHAHVRNLFLQPLRSQPEIGAARLLTLWPAGITTSATSPEEIDWEGGARLLAALHRASFMDIFAGSVVPKAGWTSRLARSRARLLALSDAAEKRIVLAAFSTLPPLDSAAWHANHESIIHGDWHPGQVVLLRGTSRLIDIDDVGVGNPAWDLARPAAWRLAGFLSDAGWNRFLNSYREAGGSAFVDADPWGTLELPARAAVIQDAAKALVRAEREERALETFESDLVGVCSRIVKLFT